MLAVVLEQPTELNPLEIMTDTGAYTDVVFGLFWLLGYRFSPRIADIGGARYWRMDPLADYGCLNGIARHRINTKLIAEHWDDLLRLAGSLKLSIKARIVTNWLARCFMVNKVNCGSDIARARKISSERWA